MISVLKKLSVKLFEQARRNVEYCERCRISFGLVAVVGFPMYYYVWHDLFPQPYENLWLRLFGSILFVPIIFVRYWPASTRKYLPWYWSIACLFSLPFFFTFMTLKNGSSPIWVESALAAIFAMALMFDWVTIIVHIIVGTGSGWLAYYLTTDLPQLPLFAFEHAAILFFALTFGLISKNYAEKTIWIEQEQAMLATAASIAHELRTPLLGIRAGAAGLRNYLPSLIETYELVRDMDLPVTPIRTVHLNTMKGVLDRIDTEANYSNAIIDMLITNVRRVDRIELRTCSMAGCVEAALHRYPFSEAEKALVSWRPGNDFNFLGSHLLMVHVLFNLLKNALRHIVKAGKGRIVIRLKSTPNGHCLIFLDTGSGVPPAAQPHIFQRFYSGFAADGSVLGSGIGLAFCRDVMRTFGGVIECSSVFGEFTRFVLTFPKVPYE